MVQISHYQCIPEWSVTASAFVTVQSSKAIAYDSAHVFYREPLKSVHKDSGDVEKFYQGGAKSNTIRVSLFFSGHV